MTFEEFKISLKKNMPPGNLGPPLAALWYDAKDNWTQAHLLVQELSDGPGAWVHGYLHRKEGDLANASYWYSRAGKKIPDNTLEEEWEGIAKHLLTDLKV